MNEPTPHLFKRAFAQCNCLWCGKRKSFESCKVTREMRIALRDFALANGAKWKSALRNLWASGADTDLLRQARNVIGPRGLDRITTAFLMRNTIKPMPEVKP